MKKIILLSSLTITLANAVLGPIPIYMNAEYRTDNPVIGSIAPTLLFDAEDIKATGASTFLEFLATVPSVGLFESTGNVPAMFMRGSDSGHTLVLVDGVKINPPNSVNGAAEYGLTNIALNDIEKIEIIKGTGSVLYGSSAIAGVISIITKKGADGTQGTIGIKLGANNAKTYALSASGGDKNAFIRFTHNKYTTDGINARTDDTTGEKDGINNQATQIKVGNKFFNMTYLVAKNRTEYDDNFGFAGTNELYHDAKLAKLSINITKEMSATWKPKLSLAETNTSRKVYQSDILQAWSDKKYKSTNITLLNDIKINNALLNIGLSQVKDENITDNKELSSRDIFVNWQKNTDNIDVNIGARHIKHNKFGNKTIYSVGTARYLDNGIKITSNYNTAFRAPSQSEVDNNSTLKPESSENIELGVEKQHNWGASSLKFYKNKVKDLIVSTGAPAYNMVNKGELKIRGVEISANANIAGYNIDFNHNYNKSRADNATTQNIRRPQNTSNLIVSKQHAKFNSRIQLIKKSSSLDIGNIEMKGYTLLNLSTKYGINKNTNAFLNIKNVTDKDYTTAVGYNQPGRTVELGLDYSF